MRGSDDTLDRVKRELKREDDDVAWCTINCCCDFPHAEPRGGARGALVLHFPRLYDFPMAMHGPLTAVMAPSNCCTQHTKKHPLLAQTVEHVASVCCAVLLFIIIEHVASVCFAVLLFIIIFTAIYRKIIPGSQPHCVSKKSKNKKHTTICGLYPKHVIITKTGAETQVDYYPSL